MVVGLTEEMHVRIGDEDSPADLEARYAGHNGGGWLFVELAPWLSRPYYPQRYAIMARDVAR